MAVAIKLKGDREKVEKHVLDLKNTITFENFCRTSRSSIRR